MTMHRLLAVPIVLLIVAFATPLLHMAGVLSLAQAGDLGFGCLFVALISVLLAALVGLFLDD